MGATLKSRTAVACPRPHPALSPEDFRKWLELRRAAGESLAGIGRSLGVGHRAITYWLDGTSGVSDTVLLLAELLRRSPVDLADGLPVGADPAGG